MKYRGVIFDLDGVICSTDYCHYQAWKAIADEEHIYFDEKINEKLRGVGRRESLEIVLEKAERKYSEMEKEKLAERKNTRYREFLSYMTKESLSPEVKTLLIKLKDSGIKIAVGSSSANAKYILSRLGLEGFFHAVSDGTNICRSKPNPEVFLKAAKMLELSPKECLVVEDADMGIRAAKEGGFHSVKIGMSTSDTKADYKISAISELEYIVWGGAFEIESRWRNGARHIL